MEIPAMRKKSCLVGNAKCVCLQKSGTERVLEFYPSKLVVYSGAFEYQSFRHLQQMRVYYRRHLELGYIRVSASKAYR